VLRCTYNCTDKIESLIILSAFLLDIHSIFWMFSIVVAWSIDATDEPATGPRLGRLVNHSVRHNAVPKVICVDKIPRLCLFASRQIFAGEQVLYNYGVKHLPFEDLVSALCIVLFVIKVFLNWIRSTCKLCILSLLLCWYCSSLWNTCQ